MKGSEEEVQSENKSKGKKSTYANEKERRQIIEKTNQNVYANA
jgi:hypothetical protein